MTAKYKLVDKREYNFGFNVIVLYRIQALIDIPEKGVKAGDKGGNVEGEHNLSHEGNCWIFDEARAIGNSRVSENAVLRNDACISENSKAFGQSVVRDRGILRGYTSVHDHCVITNRAKLIGDVSLCGNIMVGGDVEIDNYGVYLEGRATIFKQSEVSEAIDKLGEDRDILDVYEYVV